MILIFTLVASPLLGFFVRRRLVAVLAFTIAASFVFTFQSIGTLLEGMGGNAGMTGSGAFGEFPTSFPVQYEQSEVFAYGIVNLVLVGIGIGVIVGVGALRSRRSAARAVVAVH